MNPCMVFRGHDGCLDVISDVPHYDQLSPHILNVDCSKKLNVNRILSRSLELNEINGVNCDWLLQGT